MAEPRPIAPDEAFEFFARPGPTDRMIIRGVERPEVAIRAQFNPEELVEEISTNWQTVAIPGASFQVLHYIGTNNAMLPLTLTFDERSENHGTPLNEARRALRSFHYPQHGGGIDKPPQRVLFLWPQNLSIVAVVETSRFRISHMRPDGLPLAMTAEIQLKESRVYPMYEDDAEAWGDFRAASLIGD